MKEMSEGLTENYFWNTMETKEKKIYCLVIYDIVNNKRRVKFAREMSGYGFRVQKFTFEAMIQPGLYKKLAGEIPKLIDPEEDSVRIYRIIGQGEVSLFGVNKVVGSEEVIIV